MKTSKKIIISAIVVLFVIIAAITAIGFSSSSPEVVSVALSETIKDDVKMIAHRGLNAIAPENTLASFELAGQNGFWGIECDIYPTTDGKWVITHDENVRRMTDKSGKITEMTFEESQTCTIDAGNGKKNYQNLKMPTLEQYLDICEKYGAVPVIEIKGGKYEDMKPLSEILKGYENVNSFVIIAFDSQFLIEMKKYLPAVTMLYLISEPAESDIDYCKENGLDGIDFNYKKTDETVIDKIVSSGLISGAWTCDDIEKAENLYSHGVKYITSNCIIPNQIK